MTVVLVIAFSGSASSGTDGADNQGAAGQHTALGSVAPAKCPSAHRAVRFYADRLREWRAKAGAGTARRVSGLSRMGACPRYLSHILQRKSFAARQAYERWLEERMLHDYIVDEGNRAWHRAVREAQRPYPGTEPWLLSCSSSEGGHGRWVPNGDGSGAGGWLQFMSGTFWRMWSAAKVDVVRRGFRVPASASSWQSPLGQALAGAWGVTHGRSGEWYGGGC